jgi:hypothetical protein
MRHLARGARSLGEAAYQSTGNPRGENAARMAKPPLGNGRPSFIVSDQTDFHGCDTANVGNLKGAGTE